ncbi:hypothetical protein DFH28DRAFT_1123497 [Melampsora americana]|nr:hypothetical protein DFH28DRAFT_1123497 [Melampsora americana]
MTDLNSFGLVTSQQQPKLRRPASHAFLSEGFRKLRGKPSQDSPLCHSSTSSQSSCSLSMNIDPDPTESSLILLSRPESIQVPDSGPLPTYLAQLSGIHYVRDPNQDPDLDADSMMSDSRSIAESDISMASPSEDHTTSILPTLDGGLGESNGPSESECSSHFSPPPAPHELLDISPENLMSQTQLSPRTCKAALPPIDLESPYAPYAPTPPLSPPSIPNFQESCHKSRFIPKTLRRLPSTASIFRKDGMGHQTQGSLQSIESFKPRSQGSSIDAEGKRFDFQATSQFNSTRLRTESRCSTTSGYSYASTNSLNGFKRHFGFGSQQHCPQPQTPITTTNLEDQKTPNANRTINSKSKGFNTILAPISRMRTYTSLSNLFKARTTHSSNSTLPSHSSTNTSPILDTHSALLSPDSGYEILDSMHLDLGSSKLSS